MITIKKIIIGIKSDEVLVNLYNEMMERLKNICPNWNEYIMPEIEFKKLKIIEALPRLYKFIEEEFILKNLVLKKEQIPFYKSIK
jgi:phosphopantetheine adenylyltransferase